MIADLIRKPETLSPDETVGKVAAKLSDCLGLPVIDKSYQGMIYLRDLVVKDFDTTAKIGSLAKNPQKIQLNSNNDELMTAFMNHPVLPVFERDLYAGTITRYDFIKTLKLKGKACEFAMDTKILSSKGDIGDARNALKTCEVALVKDGNKVIGAVDVFSLARQIIPKQHKQFTTDKLSEKNIGIDTVMTKAVEVDMDLDVHKALELLKTNSFLVCNDYIITPRTILIAIKSEVGEDKKKGILEIVGFDMVESSESKVNAFDGGLIIKEIETFAARTEKRIKPQEIKFHLQVSKKLGKDLYEIYAKIVLGANVLTAHVQQYELLDAVQDVINKLDIQVEKVKGIEDNKMRNIKRRAGKEEI